MEQSDLAGIVRVAFEPFSLPVAHQPIHKSADSPLAFFST